MIAGVEAPIPPRPVPWAFWIASGLAAAGGIVPVVMTGTSSRISGVIVPFWLAALALGACALFHHLGKWLSTVLYLAAGLAVVYGVLGMFAVLLQLSVLGTCPPLPAECGLGYTRPLTAAESSGLAYAMGLGMLAVLIGFAGLLRIYRRQRAQPLPPSPPVRRIAPMAASPHAAEPPASTPVTGTGSAGPDPAPADDAQGPSPARDEAGPEATATPPT